MHFLQISIGPLFLSDNDIFKLSTCDSNATIAAFIDAYVCPLKMFPTSHDLILMTKRSAVLY